MESSQNNGLPAPSHTPTFPPTSTTTSSTTSERSKSPIAEQPLPPQPQLPTQPPTNASQEPTTQEPLSIPNILHMLQHSKSYQPVLPPLGQSLSSGGDPLQPGGNPSLLSFANLTGSSSMNPYPQGPLFPFQSLPLMSSLNLLNPSHPISDTSQLLSSIMTPSLPGTSSTYPAPTSSTPLSLDSHNEGSLGLNSSAPIAATTTATTTTTTTTAPSSISLFGFSPRVSQQQSATNPSENYQQSQLQFLQQLQQLQQLQLQQITAGSSTTNSAETPINTSPIVPIAISKSKSTPTTVQTGSSIDSHINVPSASTAFLPTLTSSTPAPTSIVAVPQSTAALSIESTPLMSTQTATSSSSRAHDPMDLSSDKILSLKKREEVARG